MPPSLGVTVWREASGDHFVQLSAGVSDTIVCNTCGATVASSSRQWTCPIVSRLRQEGSRVLACD